MEKMKLSQLPSAEQQEACREFLRQGLTDPKPLYAGSVSKGHHLLDTDAQNALEHINKLLGYGEMFGSFELYSNGFNVFIRSAFQEHAIAVYRYRVEA